MSGPPFFCLAGCGAILWSRKSRASHYTYHPTCRVKMCAAQDAMQLQATAHLPPPVPVPCQDDPVTSPNSPNSDAEQVAQDMSDLEQQGPFLDLQQPLPASPLAGHETRGVTVEEVEDEETPDQGKDSQHGEYDIEEFPNAGEVKAIGKSDRLREFEAQASRNEEPWAPFASYQEWEFAHWLIKSGMSQAEMTKFFKLQWVRLNRI
ncbi:hypothetical protein FRC05_009480 [Tulasnella sp. 425]|nr:hypothetical protein FRC05_009480 [Tulasnella sp. 425]